MSELFHNNLCQKTQMTERFNLMHTPYAYTHQPLY